MASSVVGRGTAGAWKAGIIYGHGGLCPRPRTFRAGRGALGTDRGQEPAPTWFPLPGGNRSQRNRLCHHRSTASICGFA